MSDPSTPRAAQRCDLVIPCRDEAGALPELIAAIPPEFRVIVVDNGSTDGTADIAAALGATVVREPRPGYGSAVHAGVLAASTLSVAVMDGDGSMDPLDLLPLLADVESGRASMASGVRRPTGRGVWPWHARLGNQAVLWWLRRRSGLGVHDIAPMRVCERQALLDLDVRDRRFGYPLELLVRAHAAGWTISERDIAYSARAKGTKSKVSGSVRGTLRAAHDFAEALR